MDRHEQELARALELETQLASLRDVHTSLLHQHEELVRDLAQLRTAHEAAEKRSGDALAASRSAVDAAQKARQIELAGERDRAAARARAVEAEHSGALKALERRHAETLASLQSAHDLALANLQRDVVELRARHEVSGVVASAAAGRAGEPSMFPRTEPETTRRPSGERELHGDDLLAGNTVAPTEEASVEPPAPTVDPAREQHGAAVAPRRTRSSGEIPATPGDARQVLRTVLARSLGGDAKAGLVITAILGAAGHKQLPSAHGELLALLERHLLAEILGHLSRLQARTLMDELVAALTRDVQKDGASRADVAHRHTTKPPPPEAGAVSKQTMRPMPPAVVRPARVVGRRAVLVIDRDRMARANVSRALARAGCEVTVRDSCADIGTGVDEFDVIVTEVENVAVENLLAAFASDPPQATIVAWTVTVDSAKEMLASAGMDGVVVVRKESRADALVAVVRTTLGEPQGLVRG